MCTLSEGDLNDRKLNGRLMSMYHVIGNCFGGFAGVLQADWPFVAVWSGIFEVHGLYTQALFRSNGSCNHLEGVRMSTNSTDVYSSCIWNPQFTHGL